MLPNAVRFFFGTKKKLSKSNFSLLMSNGSLWSSPSVAVTSLLTYSCFLSGAAAGAAGVEEEEEDRSVVKSIRLLAMQSEMLKIFFF